MPKHASSNLREHLGLEKQKANKFEAVLATHAVDGVTLAASQFVDYLPFENLGGRGQLKRISTSQ